jgi:hypothetical protein
MNLAASVSSDFALRKHPPGDFLASVNSAESVWIEPPDFRPPALAVPWAPPPMLVQAVPPPPFAHAVWIGGYWIWQRGWVWAYGMWSAAPRAGVQWVHPRYEHRDGLVQFTAGHWAEAGTEPDSKTRPDEAAVVQLPRASSGGCRVIGDEGFFVPAPPGSRSGLVVPAPAGTPPAVVIGAPPLVAVGMRVCARANARDGATHWTVVAPPGAALGGRAVNLSVPTEAHLAASMPAVVRALAPRPGSEFSIRYVLPARARAA